MTKALRWIAAVDIGSSSLRMVVARVVQHQHQEQLYIIDSLREPVRLGAGLNEQQLLDEPTQQRALEALKRFAERLRPLPKTHIRAVATNAVRVAKNGTEFMQRAEAALGVPIDIISGVEEARLVYSGVAHQLPMGQGQRLVVDIGGGSTEVIVGQDHTAMALESIDVGCVSTANIYFSDGAINPRNMRNAIMAARKEFAVLRRNLPHLHWTHAVGSSGTARSLAQLCVANGFTQTGISKQGLARIRRAAIKAGHVGQIELQGLKPDRLPIMPAGLAIMTALFDELEIEHMEVTEGALRQGLLYDILGRQHQDDRRDFTVSQFMQRYGVDALHAEHVAALSLKLFNAMSRQFKPLKPLQELLRWAALLHELGLSIGHNGHHKHAAYVLGQGDMPGFSKREQFMLSNWVLAHNGKLSKVQGLATTPLNWAPAMCLRLAALLLRRRQYEGIPKLKAVLLDAGIELNISARYLKHHPLTQYTLETEMEEWHKIGLELRITAPGNRPQG